MNHCDANQILLYFACFPLNIPILFCKLFTIKIMLHFVTITILYCYALKISNYTPAQLYIWCDVLCKIFFGHFMLLHI